MSVTERGYKPSAFLLSGTRRQQNAISRSARERELIRKLHKRHGMDKNEIAKVLGKSARSVAMSLKRAATVTAQEISDLRKIIDARGLKPVLGAISKLTDERIAIDGEIVGKEKRHAETGRKTRGVKRSKRSAVGATAPTGHVAPARAPRLLLRLRGAQNRQSARSPPALAVSGRSASPEALRPPLIQ
jgi:chorismate mutase